MQINKIAFMPGKITQLSELPTIIGTTQKRFHLIEHLTRFPHKLVASSTDSTHLDN
jgi:hypothetical protein